MIMDFIQAALPWVVLGLGVAFCITAASALGKKNRERAAEGREELETYASQGIAIGLCMGPALGILLFHNIALGMGPALLFGYAIGASIEKKEDVKKEGK